MNSRSASILIELSVYTSYATKNGAREVEKNYLTLNLSVTLYSSFSGSTSNRSCCHACSVFLMSSRLFLTPPYIHLSLQSSGFRRMLISAFIFFNLLSNVTTYKKLNSPRLYVKQNIPEQLNCYTDIGYIYLFGFTAGTKTKQVETVFIKCFLSLHLLRALDTHWNGLYLEDIFCYYSTLFLR